MENTCCRILDALSEAIARYNPGTLRITFANRGFESLCGQPAAAALGKTVTEVFGQSQDSVVWQQTLQQVQATGVPAAFLLSLPAQGKHLQVEILPELDAAGQLTCLLSVARDTTNYQRAEEELDHFRQQITQQREELTRANGHLENFVYTVAHDLRSPVGNLSVLTNLLLERPHDEESQLLMEHMQASVKQLENTITDLVEVLEVQSTFKVVAHRLRLDEVYAEILAELGTDITADVTVEVNFTNLPEVTYIRSYLLSIFRNLLGNALKYRATQRPLVVQVTAWAENNFAVLRFQDNGIGMDLANQGHKLFLPFSRLTTQAEGKGIGLHLVNNIVQKNGGRIEVESSLNEGTTFTCFLREY